MVGGDDSGEHPPLQMAANMYHIRPHSWRRGGTLKAKHSFIRSALMVLVLVMVGAFGGIAGATTTAQPSTTYYVSTR